MGDSVPALDAATVLPAAPLAALVAVEVDGFLCPKRALYVSQAPRMSSSNSACLAGSLFG